MGLLTKECFLIAPSNDLESKTIHGIAKTITLEAYTHDGPWGASLHLDYVQKYEHLWQGKKHLIIVELPGIEAEDFLRNQGYTLHVIDHHKYSGMDRSKPQTSIEQFCNLLDVPMTREHKLIAHNDSDFIEGMRKAGATYEEMKRIRREDREAQGNFADLGNYPFPHQQLHDLNIWLAPMGKLSAGLAEYIQTPCKDEYDNGSHAKPCLLILYNNSKKQHPLDCIEQIEFYGNASQRKMIDSLLADPAWKYGFSLWSGGGQFSAFMGAKVKEAHTQHDIDGLINAMLSLFLVTGKPLLDYDCTFYLPLDHLLDSELGIDLPPSLIVDDKADYIERIIIDPTKKLLNEHNKTHETPSQTDQYNLRQASEYMHTRVHSQMFEEKEHTKLTSNISAKHFRLTQDKIAKAQLVVTNTSNCIKTTGNIADVSLYQFHNHLAVLALRITMPPLPTMPSHEEDLMHGKGWWRLLFADTFDDLPSFWQQRQVNHWLNFTKMSRILYADFYDQLTEKKIAPLHWVSDDESANTTFKVQDSFNTIVINLLKVFFPNLNPAQDGWARNQRLRHVYTNFMHVNVAYTLAGEAPCKQSLAYENAQRLFSLALYVDEESDSYDAANGYAYDQQFTQELLEKHQYNRWNDIGTYMGFCPYASVFMGYGYFFKNVISPTHVPYVYGRMFIEALHYRNTLAHFDRHITAATNDLVTNKQFSHQFRDLRKEFIQFTNHYWVRHLTPQVQGVEIYQMISQSLDLSGSYEQVKDQMERADEYSTTLRDSHYGEIAFYLALISIIAAVAAVSWVEDISITSTLWPFPILGVSLANYVFLCMLALISLRLFIKIRLIKTISIYKKRLVKRLKNLFK